MNTSAMSAGSAPKWHPSSSKFAILFLAVAALLCWLGYALQPEMRGDEIEQNHLDALVPTQFGDWREVKSPVAVVSAQTPGELTYNQPYDAQVLRSYRNSANQIVMIALAYGKNQRQDIKVHRPEVCYSASGRQVSELKPYNFPLTSSKGTPVTGMRMISFDKGTGTYEPVTYWVRIGDTFSQSGMTQRIHILMEGIQGRRSDGILVRFSQIIRKGQNAEDSYALQANFAKEMVAAMPPEGRRLLMH